MVRVDLELEGEAGDVLWSLRRIVDGAGMGTVRTGNWAHVPAAG